MIIQSKQSIGWKGSLTGPDPLPNAKLEKDLVT